MTLTAALEETNIFPWRAAGGWRLAHGVAFAKPVTECAHLASMHACN